MRDVCEATDLVASRLAWVLWGIPLAALALGALLAPWPRALLWTPALLVAGVACVVNARQCHRRHCYVTGPLYLAAALVSLLRGLEIVALPWVAIGFAVAAGTVLAHVPEWTGGKYVGQPSACTRKGGEAP